ncbi:oligopeptide ABC transporter permease [Clostridium algidicarnis]|uniref:Peptide/nickel transport system permease protein n=1 Tax=Clostridium algidicarnis DSM 15099 TaxID=1121295 RepID=A0A2S6FW08_9CLOT|nr:oligopeptide ABC transporter permease [Clostridium algidicarnis]MBB6631865.1 ABC transporter permease [Clostridium algidicarnis]MBB6698435.1 ABC transporter permease [Clostridium algidicarnis]MBU3193699.1 ABC transporter permease [Clostridium algidicarnis]MBU3207284.1 ABC transporter permease [Clostridium algidicarnis]MCB2286655.1 ABC transporter permease [Clostridium algidicarnis]
MIKNRGLNRFKKNKLAIIGTVLILILVVFSIIAPLIISKDINKVDLMNISMSPSKDHILGTDEMGRDVFARLVYGGRVSLTVGMLGMLIQIFIGTTLGIIAGFYGGVVDSIIMRIVDVFMCFPFFVIAIAMAAILGPNIWNVIIIIGVLSWTGIARIVRAEILKLKKSEYIEAAHALGIKNIRILLKHLLPNIIPSVIVASTLSIASGILTEASLSFLGMGVKPPQPSWGNMLAAAQNMRTLQSEWWLWIPPGLCVFLTVMSINFMGDGMRDFLDPNVS